MYVKCSRSETDGHYTLNQANNVPASAIRGVADQKLKDITLNRANNVPFRGVADQTLHTESSK